MVEVSRDLFDTTTLDERLQSLNFEQIPDTEADAETQKLI
jgi:hypothetical protein